MSLEKTLIPAGLLLVDKEKDLTSHDVVSRLRKYSKIKKVGHTGTLDPLATGLMGVLFGSATALEPYLSKMEKSYEAEIVLGLLTDTLDVTGQILAETADGAKISHAAAEAALKTLEGLQDQVPPIYSAIKVGGVASYKAARRGEELELAARPVCAHELKILKINPPFVTIYARVSSGYYIRSLARDLGLALGLKGAVLKNLRRLSVGDFTIEKASTLAEINTWGPWLPLSPWNQKIIRPSLALPQLKTIYLDEEKALRFQAGQKLVPGRDFKLNENDLLNTGENFHQEGERKVTTPYKILNLNGETLLGLGRLEIKPSLGGLSSPRGPYLRPLRVLA